MESQGITALLGQMALQFEDNKPRRDCSTCVGPTFFRPICDSCDDNHSAWESPITTEQTIERLMEIAIEAATSRSMTRVLMATGKDYEWAERDHNDDLNRLRAALVAAMTPNAPSSPAAKQSGAKNG